MEKVVLDNSGSLTIKGKRELGSSYGDTVDQARFSVCFEMGETS